MADIEGVGKEWESSCELRTRMLETKLLTIRPEGHKWCEANRPNCVANTAALMPILDRMKNDDSMKLPVLEDLKKQIGIVYHRLAIQIKEKEIYTTAVELKKLCSFVKRRANRLEVTKDHCYVMFGLFLKIILRI